MDGTKWGTREQEIADDQATIAAACEKEGMALTVSLIKTKRATTPHWQFRVNGAVVLHHWPTAGSWYAPADNRKGEEKDARKVFELARDAARQLSS